MASIFISHSSLDKSTARQLAEDLAYLGHKIWLDEWKIMVGQCIPTEIEKGIEEADFVILLLSTHAIQSSWVDKEWKMAYWDEVISGSIVVLPALLEKCKIPKLIQMKKYANFARSYAVGFHELVEAIDVYGEIKGLRKYQQVLDNVGLTEIFSNRAEYLNVYSFERVVDNALECSEVMFFSVTALNLSLRSGVIQKAVDEGLHLKVALIDEQLAPVLKVSINDLRASINRWKEVVEKIKEAHFEDGSIELRSYTYPCFDQCCAFVGEDVGKLAYIWRFGQGEYDKSVFVFTSESESSLYFPLKERYETLFQSGKIILKYP